MRKLLVALLITALLLAVFGCRSTPEPSPSAPVSPSPSPTETPVVTQPPSPIELNFNILENDEHPQGVAMHKFAEKVEELSSGQIKVNTYPNGELFSTLDPIQALMDGSLDMATVAFSDISTYMPEAAMFAAPYVLRKHDTLDEAFSSEAVKSFYQRVSDICHYTPIGYMSQGYRTVNSRLTDPIVTPADLDGFKLRMPGGKYWSDMGKSLGADVVSVAFTELYDALKNGDCDGQDNPYAVNVAMKFYEVTKQISTTYHLNDVKLMCVSNKLWDTLTVQQKQWFYEAAKFAGEQGTQATIGSEVSNLKIMTGHGLFVTDADRNAFAEYSHQYYIDNGLTSAWDMNLYNAIQAIR